MFRLSVRHLSVRLSVCHLSVRLSRRFCSGGGHGELLWPAASPCLMLPPSFTEGGDNNMIYNVYSLIMGKVVSFNNRGGKEEADLMQDKATTVVGSSHGWLVLLNSRSRQMFLCNPHSGCLVGLPPFAGKPFSAKDVEAPWLPKVIISCPPHQEEEECRALMILGANDKARAAICRPGRSTSWAPLDEWPAMTDCLRLYFDFAYSAERNRFFGSVSSGVEEEYLEGWEISSSTISGDDSTTSLCQRMDRSHRYRGRDLESHRVPYSSLFPTTYLVYEESNQLFLVKRYTLLLDVRLSLLKGEKVDRFFDRENVDFDVFRIDDGGAAELCSSLDDLAMFVGINHSFAVKASRFPGLKPNSIYYSDSRYPLLDDLTSQTIEVFDYQNKTCSPVYYPSRHLKNRTPHPWFTPSSLN